MAFDLATNTTLQVLGALDRGEVSSTEVLSAMIANIEAHNPAVNAVVAMDFERAHAEAAAADDLYASGDERGPLHGLPMTIKDVWETLDLATSSGSPALREHLAERDADVVRLLRRAGAIIWAKTNVPLWASDHQSYNDVHGTTNNPWDLTRTAGGSSGGAAAAVACGMSTLEVGSDIGASIRLPASFNGVFGLKTTHGLISGRGHIPGRPGSLRQGDLEVFGPMGRSCGDLRILLEILTASQTAFGGVPGAALPMFTSPPDIVNLRVGIWSDDPVAPVDAGVRSVVEQVGADLEAAGALVDTEIRPTIASEKLFDIYLRLLNSEMSTTGDAEHFAALVKRGEGDDDEIGTLFARNATMRHRDWLRADEARAHAMVAWERVFEEVDVVVAPAAPVPAFPHDIERSYNARTLHVNGQELPYSNLLFWAGLATMPLLPAVTIPVGMTADGLPIGVQVIGPKWSDHKLLGMGEEIASVLGARFTPPPMVG